MRSKVERNSTTKKEEVIIIKQSELFPDKSIQNKIRSPSTFVLTGSDKKTINQLFSNNQLPVVLIRSIYDFTEISSGTKLRNIKRNFLLRSRDGHFLTFN